LQGSLIIGGAYLARLSMYLFYRRGRFLSTPFPFVRMLEILQRRGTRNSTRSRCGPRLPSSQAGLALLLSKLERATNAESLLGLLKGSRSAFLCFAFSLCFRFHFAVDTASLTGSMHSSVSFFTLLTARLTA